MQRMGIWNHQHPVTTAHVDPWQVWCKPMWGTKYQTSKTYVRQVTDESRVKNHTKNTTHLTNTITMVVEPPSPLAAWI